MMALLKNLIAGRTILGVMLSGMLICGIYNDATDLGEDRITVFFSGLMGLASVASGFIGAFYFFIAARSSGFLGEIQNTRSFQELLLLTRHCFVVSVLLVALCLRNMVHAPGLIFGLSFEALPSYLSVVLASYFFGTAWRCMALFRMLTER